MRDENSKQESGVRRRALVGAAAWSAPVVLAVSGSPAAAASIPAPCFLSYPGRVNLEQTTGPGTYVRTPGSTTSGSSLVTLQGAPAEATPVRVGFLSTLVAETGYSLNQSNLQRVPVNGVTYLALFQNVESPQVTASTPARGQIMTISFSRPVTSLVFSLRGFTRGTYFSDNAYITGDASFTTTGQGADVSGAGTSSAPWTTNRDNTASGSVTDANTVRGITFAGPVQVVSIHYYSTRGAAITGQFQVLYLTDLNFAASCS